MTDGAVFDSCIYHDGCDDPPEFVRVSTPRARRQYTCCECGHVIHVGTVYESTSGKWGGEMATFRTCVVCVSVRDSLCKGGYAYGELWEAVRDAYDHGSDDDDDEDGDWLVGPPLADREHHAESTQADAEAAPRPGAGDDPGAATAHAGALPVDRGVRRSPRGD
jgi:hypothetical protein